MRRSAFPSQNRRRQQIAWPPKRRFGCGVGSVGLKAPSFKEDTAQKRWNREAKAADRADHRWRHEEAAAERKRQDQAAAAAFEAEEEDAARRWEEEMAAALPPPPPKALSPEKRARIERNRAAALALKRRKLSESRGRDGMPGVGGVRGIQEAGS